MVFGGRRMGGFRSANLRAAFRFGGRRRSRALNGGAGGGGMGGRSGRLGCIFCGVSAYEAAFAGDSSDR